MLRINSVEKIASWVRKNGPFMLTNKKIVSGNELLKMGDKAHILHIRGRREGTLYFIEGGRFFKSVEFTTR